MEAGRLETQGGIATLQNIDKFPESHRQNIIDKLNKKQALVDYNFEEGYHELMIFYHEDAGDISIEIQKPTTIEHLRELLHLANYVGAKLMIMEEDIVIDDSIIEDLE
ncbi:hypothetical protein CLV59_107359 [Chitinophaga dinghuensis]|uniref:Uncharacterized protein n=1 Tax=Chitinophaga dinghuensis TaxID=1539050 RepID=A0A327W0M3_9BACT|nr:hypothetical protein [Chitinophaga dinghuensis]RAJ77592.1 hypothetical protein CLV59_107359 [Chitinophaga dinghuensis]